MKREVPGSRAILRVLSCLVLTGVVSGARAQGTPGSEVPQSAPVEPVDPVVSPDSPRAVLEEFRDLVRNRQWDGAVSFLDLSERKGADGETLVRKLVAVLDHYGWPDPAQVSSEAEGRTDDGLPQGVDEVLRIPMGAGHREPLRLVRNFRDGKEGPSWRISRRSVERIDEWFEELPGRWMYEAFPDWALQATVWGVLVWQWPALAVSLVLAFLLAVPLAGATRMILLRLASRTRNTWDDALAISMRGPFRLAWVLVLLRLGIPWLAFSPEALRHLWQLLVALAWLDFFWALFRTMDVFHWGLENSPWARESSSARFVLSFGTKIGKLLVAGLGAVAALAALGYPVASLLAGLGIGGLALALAAQKTVENLFGAFSIGLDRPIQVGDFITVDGISGTVETIGLRSTRIRTLERILVSIPNGKFADMRLENLSARDRFLLQAVIGLEYGTQAQQLRQVIREVRAFLASHPRIWPEQVLVHFQKFGQSSLDIEVMAWFLVEDFAAFREVRQEVLLGIMDIVERSGCAFAFPTRTVHLVTGAPRVEGTPGRQSSGDSPG